MNKSLQKEIILHIFKRFRIFNDKNEIQTGFIDELLDIKFLINKKLFFELDGKKYQKNLWASQLKIDKSNIKILIADIQEVNPEFTLLIQMDNLPVYSLRISNDEEDYGSFYINTNEKWIEAPILVQAKFLCGVEGLSEVLVAWEPLTDYKFMYDMLIDFLNFNEGD